MPYLATVAVNLYPRRSWASGLWLLQLTPDRAVTVEAPDATIADKGYDADHLVDRIAESGTEVVIPPKHNRNFGAPTTPSWRPALTLAD